MAPTVLGLQVPSSEAKALPSPSALGAKVLLLPGHYHHHHYGTLSGQGPHRTDKGKKQPLGTSYMGLSLRSPNQRSFPGAVCPCHHVPYWVQQWLRVHNMGQRRKSGKYTTSVRTHRILVFFPVYLLLFKFQRPQSYKVHLVLVFTCIQ